MTNRRITRGGVLHYAKFEYLFDKKIDNAKTIIILTRLMKDPVFRANVYINWLQQPGKKILKKIIRSKLYTKYHFIIGESCVIGQHFRSTSTEGTVIGEGVKIGDCCRIEGRVTIGQKDGQSPEIGNNVFIKNGSVVIGHISVGDRATIEEHSVVINNVPMKTIVRGVPAKIMW